MDRRWSLPLIGLALLGACTSGAGDVWNGHLPHLARPEHPRPDLRRRTFVNLNTRWRFAYDPDGAGEREAWWRRDDVWTHEIQLPFAWEAPAAGLETTPSTYSPLWTLGRRTYHGVAWYRLELPALPERAPGEHWYLVIGAADYETKVWIGDHLATVHAGGYTPFAVDLEALAPERGPIRITLRILDDPARYAYQVPVGKQGGIWYTPTSGVWQTVYLERRPASHVVAIQPWFDPVTAGVRLQVHLNAPATGRLDASASLSGETLGTATTEIAVATDVVELTLPLTRIHRWSPDTPTLYDLELRWTATGGVADVVASYFGLVTVTTAWLPSRGPAAPVTARAKALYLNGRPIYLRCILDQAYWPDGVYTAPSLAAIRADVELARRLGFNCVRHHIKVDEPWRYRIYDELGMLVVYDLPNLDMRTDNRSDTVGRRRYERMLRRAIRRDALHPSIVAWVLFNENWGLSATGGLDRIVPLAEAPEVAEWVRRMVVLARRLDPAGRPVEDNSAGGIVGRFEHVETDLDSFHVYAAEATALRELLDREEAAVYPGSTTNFVAGGRRDGDPWWNSEFGPFSTIGAADRQAFCTIYDLVAELRRRSKLVGFVLTQLYDVEYELNGLVHYDRSPKTDLCERAGVSLPDVLGADAVGFDTLGGIRWARPATHTIWYAHWSSSVPVPRRLRLYLDVPEHTVAETTVTARPYGIVRATFSNLMPPADPGPHWLAIEALGSDGRRVAANRIWVTVP